MSHDVCLITPTRDRPEAMALCARWMRRQTFMGKVQWLIVDDGDTPIDPALPFPAGWAVEHVRRQPSEAAHTLTANLLAALPRVDAPLVLVIEDDEHYAPVYVEEMAWRLSRHDLVGECKARYYNVVERRWSIMTENNAHASLCRTGLRASLLPEFQKIVQSCHEKGNPFVDIVLWGSLAPVRQTNPSAPAVTAPTSRPWAAAANWRPSLKQAPQTSPEHPRPPWPKSKLVTPPAPDHDHPPRPLAPDVQSHAGDSRAMLFEGRGISVGIKGMPGRGGIGRSHASKAFPNVDQGWSKLIEWCGPDAQQYIDLAKRLELRPST